MSTDKPKLGHYRGAFPPNTDYIGAIDLWPDKEATVTIEAIDPKYPVKDRGNKTTEKLVITFKGKQKKWIVGSKNRAREIARVIGSPEMQDWIGKTITIYCDPTVRFGNEITGGIRVKKKG